MSLVSFGYTQEERITITTYYPAPYGVYSEMRVKKMAVGDTYDSPSAVSIPTGTSLIVEGKVSIGTTRPASTLDLGGHTK